MGALQLRTQKVRWVDFLKMILSLSKYKSLTDIFTTTGGHWKISQIEF